MNRIWKEMSSGLRISLAVIAALIVVVIFAIVMTSGKKGAEKAQTSTADAAVEVTTPATTKKTTVTTTTEKMTAAVAPSNISPLIGLELEKEDLEQLKTRRPLLVSYDNHNAAWPQSGISKADLYIEVLAEGLITRFLALYYTNVPEIVGPVRSARPYIVVKALEYDAFLAHVGGSQQALTDIIRFEVADLDGLWSGAFFRTSPKVPPHNTYAYYVDLMAQAESNGERMQGVPDFYSFGDAHASLKDQAEHVRFGYRDDVYGDGGYVVEYVYDAEKKTYARLVNGLPFVDEQNGEQIEVSNIIVQYASHQVLDDEGRLYIDLFSGGEGYLLRDGKIAPVTWSKSENEALTAFVYEDGSEILLRPGKTAIHIVYPGIFSREGEEY